MKLPPYFHHIYTSDAEKTVKHSNVGGFSHRLRLFSRIFQAGVPGRPGQAHSQGPAGREAVPADQWAQIQRKTLRRRFCPSVSASFVSPNQTWRLHVPLVSLLTFWVHLRPPLPPPRSDRTKGAQCWPPPPRLEEGREGQGGRRRDNGRPMQTLCPHTCRLTLSPRRTNPPLLPQKRRRASDRSL